MKIVTSDNGDLQPSKNIWTWMSPTLNLNTKKQYGAQGAESKANLSKINLHMYCTYARFLPPIQKLTCKKCVYRFMLRMMCIEIDVSWETGFWNPGSLITLSSYLTAEVKSSRDMNTSAGLGGGWSENGGDLLDTGRGAQSHGSLQNAQPVNPDIHHVTARPQNRKVGIGASIS